MDRRLLVVDDHEILRQGLKALVKAQIPEFEIAEATDGKSAVAVAADWSPDVVVMDVAMPNLNGFEATRRIVAANPRTEVVILSAHANQRLVTDALEAGASAYVPKEAAFEELTDAIHSILAGKVYISPALAKRMEPRHEIKGERRLTPRETEVLKLIAEGAATKLIAHDLQVSVKTVETHRRRIMEKLAVHSIAELTKYAIREGLTDMYSSHA